MKAPSLPVFRSSSNLRRVRADSKQGGSAANASNGHALVNELQRFLRGFLEIERLLPLMYALHLVLRAISYSRAAYEMPVPTTGVTMYSSGRHGTTWYLGDCEDYGG